MAHFKSFCAVLHMTISLMAGSVRAADSALVAGVVVEKVGKGSAIEKAGVQLGDILISWEQKIGPNKQIGVINNPFDWMWLEIDRVPRATIQLIGQRGLQPISFLVDKGPWETEVRPNIQEPALALYLFGKGLISSGEIQDGAFVWERALQEQSKISGKSFAAWIHLRLATISMGRSDWQQAGYQYQIALLSAPSSAEEALIHFVAGNAYLEQESFTEAETAYCSALHSQSSLQNGEMLRAELHSALGRTAWRQGHIAKAEYYWSKAFAIQSISAPQSLPVAESLINLSNLASVRGDLRKAVEYLRRSINILDTTAPNSLGLAGGLNNLGNIMAEIGDYREARKMFMKALNIRRAQAPESLDVASSFVSLGNLEGAANLELAEKYYRAALEIQTKLAPRGLQAAVSLTNLASLLADRGDLRTAKTYYETALQIQQRLSPESLDFSVTLCNQASLYRDLGDLEMAEEIFKKALTVQERAAPGSLFVAHTLSYLGGVAADRADLDAAEAYYIQALEIQEKLAPESFDVAITLANIGDLAWTRGDAKSAEIYRLRALSIIKTTKRDDLYTAVLLNNLGNMAWAQGKPKEASAYLKQAFEIEMRLAPAGIDAAWTLQNLGYLAQNTGDVKRALEYLERALRIKEKLMPKSWAEAEVLHDLGLLHRAQKHPSLALAFFLRTLDAVESQVGKLGGTHDVKSSFRAQNQEYYSDAIQQLIEDGQTKQAFQVLESARARGFIAMLAERDIILDQDLPADLKKRRQSLSWQYDRTQQEILDSSPKHGTKHFAQLLLDLQEIRRQIAEVDSAIRRFSPKLGALRYPEIIDADATAASLDPGTLMLSYSVGRNFTYIFSVSRDRPLGLQILDIGEDELRGTVALFASLIRHSSPASKSGEFRSAQLEALAVKLFLKLIEPVLEAAEESERLLIIPDGPLHVLPWGALIRSIKGEGRDKIENLQYLTEWKPIHTAVSATAYFEVGKLNIVDRSDPGEFSLVVAFGDPIFPQSLAAGEGVAISDVRVHSLAERGFEFEPLPATRREVDEISRLYPRRALAYLGREATEEHAKSIPRDTRIVHFATHGVIDERFPFNSAIVLSIPEKFEEGHENGLLQAWEIFEQVRLNADLVVLSACESGLGKEMGGEGLIGLTRAFQYAGARSVMASLWKISDRTTAEFMVRFYRHLKEGLSKDEALRFTQMEFIRDPIQVTNEKGERVDFDASAPYYWAAFQIYGDWQ